MNSAAQPVGPISDRLRRGIESTSAAETVQLASSWTAELPDAVWLALHGDLGVGKTTFVGGLASGFGIVGAITSPSFAILNIYQGKRQLLHVDAYRLASEGEADELLLDDWIRPPFCVAVEWPEVMGSLLPADTLHLDLSISSPGHHAIRLL